MILETSINGLPSKTKNAKSTKQPLSLRVQQHRIMVGCLLKHLGMVEPSLDVNKSVGPQQTGQ